MIDWKHNKKNISIIGVVVAFFIFISVAILIFGEADHDIVIDRYEATITINDAGDMTVTERMDMRYLYGDFRVRFYDVGYEKFPQGYPLPYSDTNTAMFDTVNWQVRVWRGGTEVTNTVSIRTSFNNQNDELGMPIRCEPPRGSCESFFVDTGFSGNLSGSYRFEYTYTILGAISQYSDISELNWVLFDQMEGPIKEGEVTIHLPNNALSDEEFRIFGHGLDRGELTIVSNQEMRIEFEDARSRDFLEFRLLMPNELFPNIAARNVFIDPDMNFQVIMDYQEDLENATNLAITLTQVFLGLSIIVALGLGYFAYSAKKKYFMPHETEFQGDYLRELPSKETPAEMSYVYYFGTPSSEDVTATLLDLVRRKYILMNHEGQELTSKDASFLLTLNKEKSVDDLLDHEKHLIDWFFNRIGDGEQVQTKAIENYGKGSLMKAETFQNDAKEFTTKIKRMCRGQDLVDNSLAPLKRKASAKAAIPIILAVIIFLTGIIFEAMTTIAMNNLFSFIVLGVAIAAYLGFINVQRRRSKEGQERFVKWDAFKNFLTDFGNFQDYPMPGIIVWEHFLVYAVSLKVADKVMEQLRVKLPMNEEMARQSTYMGVGYGRRGFYYGAGFTSFNQTMTRARSNSSKTISSARSSKGGRGGGFSGGSSFGGGGGGGRSR